MWKFIPLLTLLGCFDVAAAGVQCTQAARSSWQPESSFRRAVKNKGYRITRFMVTPGHCYEVYGFDARNQRVLLYFNPVSGALVKSQWVARR